MKKLAIIAAAIACLSACTTGKHMDTPKDKLVHQLFEFAEQGKIAYGHQDDLSYGHAWTVEDWESDSLERSDIKAVCGSYPMVVGFDLGDIEHGADKNLDGVPFGLIRKAALKHIERGGIVTFSWHPDNLVTGGDAWDVSSDQVVKSILPGGDKHAEFMEWLRRAADFIESLGDVAIIFRPWHENVASWFWWGGNLCSADEYRELYRLTWVYFTKDRGLTNIVWCYSPNGDCTPDEYMDRYPGDEFVDMLGFDTYEFAAPMAPLEEDGAYFMEELRDNLVKLNAIATEHKKLQCLSETGFEGIPDPHWWTEVLYPVIKDFPISYVLTWRNACDKPSHFYGPWPGFEWAGDFASFAGYENIVMLPVYESE